MAQPATILVNRLISHLKYLDKTRIKMEKMFTDGDVVKRDMDIIYSGLFLEAVTCFESFIEELFIGMLVGRLIHPSSDVILRTSFKSDKIAVDVIHGGLNYLDWFPYDKTIKRATAYFRGGRPFTYLDNIDKKKIYIISIVRNALAHKSKHAINLFDSSIIAGIILTPQEKTPSGFLRSRFSATPPQTQYEKYITDIATIARKLSS